jgi:hypothetical protein
LQLKASFSVKKNLFHQKIFVKYSHNESKSITVNYSNS